jgi:hypothetical protein
MDARKDGVHDGRRELALRRGERLDDEERVAPSGVMKPLGVCPLRSRQCADRGRRERCQPEAVNTGGSCELAEHPAHRMTGLQLLLPGCQHDERAELGEPPAQEQQCVERGLVRPVEIFDD